ncbi:hypothetical protein MHU86_19500 [Fragilaria crotonensis]|nr:hypothetical protein MHU86_19500 [Fragilaria crotonensis]
MKLQNAGHSILVMMDANGTIYQDKHLQEFIGSCDLSDLHSTHPAPSTFIGSANRRIDYILGCPKVVSSVMRQGSLAYIEGPQSDHRGLYVDLRLEEILGDTVDSPMDTPNMRSLYSGNPEMVATYLSGVRKYYETHNMESRIQELHARHQEMTTPQLRKLLCAWDNDQGRAMMHAEKVLHIQPKTYKWSPKLRNTGVIMRYWKLRLRELLHGADYQETFQRWETKIQEFDSSFRLPEFGQALDVNTVRKRLNEASKQLRIVQKHSLSHRQQSFQDLLDTYDADTNHHTKHESMRKAKIVRRTLSSESNRNMFSHIKNLIKPGGILSTHKVENSSRERSQQGNSARRCAHGIGGDLPCGHNVGHHHLSRGNRSPPCQVQ